ncbi:AAA family ATPase [Collimonas sp. OK412]|jgi:predicted ATPase|uniref:AAA family ATPase n=1 Tax=Collimonas sp. (strain OK412) TaxID=1801619 RepID=UPI0008ED313A|nr:AAA family ATPase [Collimonas sp. OK412]SFD01066.1 AAA domain-containing protein, putative AbiEii toxin, Type IV TA system [Collimonas sp. OK412]
MLTSSQFAPLEHSPIGGVTFLVGQNGSGKSTCLAGFAKHALACGKNVLAISNTIYDRFPRRKGSYSELATRFGRGLPGHVIKHALSIQQERSERNAERIAKILDYLGFEMQIGLSIKSTSARKSDLYERWPDLSSEQYERIESSLNYMQSRSKHSEDGILWLDVYGLGHERNSFGVLDLLRYEGGARNRQYAAVSVHLRKRGQTLNVTAASSGELTLLSMYIYLATHITEGAVILIDEPENSLHPSWQHEYCVRLLDMFHLYQPQIVVATHSPIIVTGAQGHRLMVEIFQVHGDTLEHRSSAHSIEETLYESFQTLPPANHYLSERVSEMLDELGRGQLTIGAVQDTLREFSKHSYDPSQRRFLERIEQLAKKVAAEARRKI